LVFFSAASWPSTPRLPVNGHVPLFAALRTWTSTSPLQDIRQAEDTFPLPSRRRLYPPALKTALSFLLLQGQVASTFFVSPRIPSRDMLFGRRQTRSAVLFRRRGWGSSARAHNSCFLLEREAPSRRRRFQAVLVGITSLFGRDGSSRSHHGGFSRSSGAKKRLAAPSGGQVPGLGGCEPTPTAKGAEPPCNQQKSSGVAVSPVGRR